MPHPVASPIIGPSTGEIVQTISTTALTILGNILGQRQMQVATPGPVPAVVATTRRLFSGQGGIVIIGALVLLFVLFRPGRKS